VSLITKRLLDEDLLRRGEPQRGRVGQPSVPLSLNPDGALAIGIKVGRRSLDALLVDFVGRVRCRESLRYEHASPPALLAAVRSSVASIEATLDPVLRRRILGVGIAAPLSMDGWQQILGWPQGVADEWRSVDLAAAVQQVTTRPVTLLKDTAAACVAELVAGSTQGSRSFLYVFVDTFVGGGLVIDGHLHAGARGNAGAVGSMALGVATKPGAPPDQTLSRASLLTLERAMGSSGLDPSAAMDERAWAPPWREVTQAWLAEAAQAIAHSVHAAACLLDLEATIVDGSFDRVLLAPLLDAIEAALARYNWEGATVPRVLAGTIGSDARALGAAWLPLYAAFAPDREAFLKAAA
jgi:predicted NBD/HSP70 family sugar kinase